MGLSNRSSAASTVLIAMTSLADTVLPLIRTRADLHRWSAANAHGSEMHEAIDVLEAARSTTDPAEFHAVVHAALASAVKVIARADDSSGIIGDACRRLLTLHPESAADAGIAPSKLVDWMIKFQLDGSFQRLRDGLRLTRGLDCLLVDRCAELQPLFDFRLQRFVAQGGVGFG